MLYAGQAMGELHTTNGPIADCDLATGEAAEELSEQTPRGYVEHRDYAAAGELPEELPRGLVERLEDLQRRLGRCEGRLELTQVAETILRKQLNRERERADRLEADLREAEAALYKAQRGWFSRFFGVGGEEAKQ
jgi:chromosome segregation ATPase